MILPPGFLSGRAHAISHEGLGDEEEAFEIDVEDGVEIGFAGVPEIGAAFKSGVVDEHVEFAELYRSVGNEFLAVTDAADVTLESRQLCAEFPDAGDDCVGSGFVRAVAERDRGAFRGESLCDGQADALVCHR